MFSIAVMFAACGDDSSSVSSSSGKGSLLTLTDSRDGQTYKTVTIGTQTWMAENLNYETANSYCYKDSAKYCAKYGRLYTWAAAMDSAGAWSSNGKGCGDGTTCSPTYPLRGVCPSGWHLPTVDEFTTYGVLQSSIAAMHAVWLCSTPPIGRMYTSTLRAKGVPFVA